MIALRPKFRGFKWRIAPPRSSHERAARARRPRSPISRRWPKVALATIPGELKRHLGPVVIRVEDFPDDETEEEMELESPFDILGLYRGVALPRKSVSDPRPDIDMIFLYRRPILDYWCETASRSRPSCATC